MRVGTLDRIRSLASLGAADEGAYVCRGCDTSFTVQYHVCPACGGYSVERRRGGSDADDESESP